ncbi:hypothetical protein [Rhizobium sp. BR 362]|uniref:hypothetical protein n=1 Tax=Rhizobium sp. BR 362 TaxID=3040670 RepID=UPI003FA6DE59
MVVRTAMESKEAEEIALKRNKLVLDQARASGLLGNAKNTRLSGRVSSELVEAAKQRAHVSSDTELLELALSRLALEDDFGAKLVRRKGSVPMDIDLGI